MREESSEGAAETSAAGADRRGRRGTRRVVAPATSGRPESEEAHRFRSASADGEVPDADDARAGGEPGPEAGETSRGAAGPPRKRVARPSGEAERLSPRDRWILQERPPHW